VRLDFPKGRSVDRLMGSQSKSASLPLTSQHSGAESAPRFNWEERYKKIGTLGSGGFAEVFKVRDLRTGEELALKVPNWSGGEELRRFAREIVILQALHHQHVIEIRDAGDDWYAMPLADGTLTSLAPELCDEERIEAMTQAAKGLAAAHAVGLVHRDVTPNNILRMGERWVVSDFGLVKKPKGQSSVPKTQGILGTPGYMAPEILVYDAHEATYHADIYGLGQAVVYMTTGKHPVAGFRYQVPSVWESLVDKMTAITIAERPQSMDEVVAALQEVRVQLKARRRAEWASGRNAVDSNVEGLHPAELKVLTNIIKETNDVFRDYAIRNEMPRGEHALFNIGFIGLKRRGFIEGFFDEDERAFGHRLTDAAHDWLMAHADLLLNAIPPDGPEVTPVPTPTADDDDNIPF